MVRKHQTPHVTKQVKIPDPLYKKAQEVKEEQDFASLGDALRYMACKGGYNV